MYPSLCRRSLGKPGLQPMWSDVIANCLSHCTVVLFKHVLPFSVAFPWRKRVQRGFKFTAEDWTKYTLYGSLKPTNPLSYKNYNLQSTKHIFMSEKIIFPQSGIQKMSIQDGIVMYTQLSQNLFSFLNSWISLRAPGAELYIVVLPELPRCSLYIVFISNTMLRLIKQLTYFKQVKALVSQVLKNSHFGVFSHATLNASGKYFLPITLL